MSDKKLWEPQSRARRRALQAIYQWHLGGQDVSEIIVQFQETQDFSGVDLDLFRALLSGVSDEREALSGKLQPAMDRPFAQCDLMERIILLMAAWHLVHRPDVPYPVLINESVDLAKRFASDQAPSYINAVLDKLVRIEGIKS